MKEKLDYPLQLRETFSGGMEMNTAEFINWHTLDPLDLNAEELLGS